MRYLRFVTLGLLALAALLASGVAVLAASSIAFEPQQRFGGGDAPTSVAIADLNTDDAINLLDLLPFKPFLNVSCA